MGGTLAFFGTGSAAGKALASSFRQLLAGPLRPLDLEATWFEDATQQHFYGACVVADVVVLDASREPERQFRNYRTANALPMAMRHILVVSRTYLPQNFHGLRTGGAPPYPESWSNEQLLDWLRTTLIGMRAEIPRSAGEKTIGASQRVMQRDVQWGLEQRGRAGQVFISYRSAHASAVEDLSKRIVRGDFHNGQPHTVKYYQPGELALERELLSGMRRWQIVSAVDTSIGVADEVWLYGSKGKVPFLASWWTQSEVAAVSWRVIAHGRASHVRIPRVCYYDPAFPDTPPREVQASQLPPLTSDQYQRMARLYSTFDPDTQGPESVEGIRKLSMIPGASLLPYLRDWVWSREFWENDLLQCDTCSGGIAYEQEPRLRFDMDTFVRMSRPLLKSFSPDQVARAVSCGELVCPDCHTSYIVEKLPSRFLWYAERMGQVASPTGLPIIEYPTIKASPMVQAQR